MESDLHHQRRRSGNIILETLGSTARYIHEIKANEMQFDREGILKSIVGTAFDFAGKRDFIKRVADERRCEAIDVLYVGNNLNYHWASQSGARTLCVNPGEMDYTNTHRVPPHALAHARGCNFDHSSRRNPSCQLHASLDT